MHRLVETARNRILAMCGTNEPAIEPTGEELAVMLVTRQWRKPLSIEEITRMADTPEVKNRKGRP